MRLSEEEEWARELTIKIRETRELIRVGSYTASSIGDVVYVPESNDYIGGIATVRSISGEYLIVNQHPDVKYNFAELMSNQPALEATHGNSWARPRP